MPYTHSMTPEAFIEVFRVAALQAGAVAHHLQGEVRVHQKPHESGPESAALTAVDLATQDVILHQLLVSAPHVALDAEEQTELVSRFSRADSAASLIVLDPIDGTLNYTRGSEDYAVMGALITQGRYEAALVYFPEHEEMFWAIRGAGCMRQCRGAEATRVSPLNTPDRVMAAVTLDQEQQRRLSGQFSEVVTSRCSAVDASVCATGRARASVAAGRSDRRRAIGYLLSTEAGGVVYHGAQRWHGEDPELLPGTLAPSIVANSESTARGIFQCLSRQSV